MLVVVFTDVEFFVVKLFSEGKKNPYNHFTKTMVSLQPI